MHLIYNILIFNINLTRKNMDILPTAQRQTFDVDAAPTEANAYSIGLDGGAAKTAVFTITLK